MRVELLAQGEIGGATLSTALSGVIEPAAFDRLEVAVAYATKQGVRTLELALGGIPANSSWIVGLDDAITQPEALEYLLGLPGSQVRVAALAPQRRFHPKLYCLSSTIDESACISAVGSGNMTLNGFRRNGETAVVLFAETGEEALQLRQQWGQMWSMGEAATQQLIDDYRTRYRAASAARRTIVRLRVAPAEPDPEAPVRRPARFDGNAANAVLAWTVVGSPSAGGLDLDFPRDIMPFFALPADGGIRRFRTPDLVVRELRFTFRPDNMMWRLLFSADSVDALIGRRSLRPAPRERSEYAVVFERTDGDADYRLSAVRIDSPEFTELVADSTSVGGLRSTRGRGSRQFGFY